MSTPDITHYRKLIATATEAAKAYYETSVEIMTDAEYDTLIDEIALIEAATGWDEAEALLDAVAAGVSDGGDVEHATPMLSLSKANSFEEVVSFVQNVRNQADRENSKVIVEPKLDGLAISAKYRNGKLVQVATRGNGQTGEDITARIGVIAGLPSVINYMKNLEVRGEVFITSVDFDTANINRLSFEYAEWSTRNPDVRKVTVDSLYKVALSNRAENKTVGLQGKTLFAPDKHIFANSRNAVAGALRRDHSDYVVPMTFAAYDIQAEETLGSSDTYSEKIAFIETLGFKSATSLIPETVRNLEVVEAIIAFGEARTAGLSYPTDGVVLKVNSSSIRVKMGEGSKAPRWAVAYKYPSTTQQTVVEGIELMIGRTGRLSLRAKVAPVLVDGTVINYASLHNVSWLEERDIRIGDTVNIRRANDVIPYIEEAVLALRPVNAQRWAPPSTCPQCDSLWDKSTLLWRCPSPSCGALNSIIFAAGRDYFDWEGLSEAIITRLNDEGLVSDIADVFSLTENQLATLSMGRQNSKGEEIVLGEKIAKKLYAQIQKSKSRPLSAVIAALGVRTLGRTFGRRLEAHYGDMSKIIAASPVELTQVEGIAIKKAEIIHAGLIAVSPVIVKLAKAGVTMVSTKKAVPVSGNPFVGKKIVITGSIPGYNRGQAQELITELGATASSSVSSSTDFLVADEEAKSSSKYTKAVTLGKKIITPEQFLEMAGKN